MTTAPSAHPTLILNFSTLASRATMEVEWRIKVDRSAGRVARSATRHFDSYAGLADCGLSNRRVSHPFFRRDTGPDVSRRVST